MIRKCVSFVLHCRLEDVVAAGISGVLLVLFLTTRLFHTFQFGMLDILFILLPVCVLGVKALLVLLLSSGGGENENMDPTKLALSFFQPLAKILRDWFPFLLLSACYYSLYNNLILHINPHLADATLSKIDGAIFGNQASILLEPYIRPWLTDFLNVVYFSHVVLFPGAALYFYVKKEEKAFRRIMMGYLTILLMGVTSYLLIPAAGPEKFLADRYTHDLQGQMVTRGVNYIINLGRVDLDCFPSLHVGIPFLLSLYLRDYRRKAFVPMLIYVACMCLATIYLRYHYVIDVIAAFVYAPAAYMLNDFLLSHWPGEKIVRKEEKAVAGQKALDFGL
jgi:membrane-associated phospholipid phosphatase